MSGNCTNYIQIYINKKMYKYINTSPFSKDSSSTLMTEIKNNKLN